MHLYYWGVPSPHLRQRSPRARYTPSPGAKSRASRAGTRIVGNPGIASMKSNTSKAFSNFSFFLPSIEDIIMKSLFLTRGRGRGCAVLHICMYVTRLGHDESTRPHDLDSLKRRDKNTLDKKSRTISISLTPRHSSKFIYNSTFRLARPIRSPEHKHRLIERGAAKA